MQNHLFVITGAAGTGKSTVQRYLCQKYHMAKVITHTTRAPRKNEKNGVDYYFETPDSFTKNHYLESVKYSGSAYGSSYEGLKDAFKHSHWAAIVLDTSGALSYLKKLKCPMTILFLHLNSIQELRNRMLERGDNKDAIEKRLHSKEFIRDQKIPPELKNHSIMIHSNVFKHTEDKINQIITSINK